MFASFNYDYLPVVYVTFNNNINEDNFNLFLTEWLSLYLKCENFIFLFDTRNITKIPHIKYSIRMSQFIKKLKKENPYHYLQKSFIVVNNKKIIYLLDFIFNIQKPVAPVFIYKTDNNDLNHLLDLSKNISSNNLLKDITYIEP